MPLLWLLTTVGAASSSLGQLPAQSASPSTVSSDGRPIACRDWRDCREQALAARTRKDYELFHDLAWRTMQTAPPKNADVMLLLARAQALSGRPHDALVMIQRLADMGVGVDVSSDDFARTRELPGWPDVAMRFVRPAADATASAGPVSTGSTASTASPGSPSAPSVKAPPAPGAPGAPGATVAPSGAVATAGTSIAPPSGPRGASARTVPPMAPPAAAAIPPSAKGVPLPVQPAARTDAARFAASRFTAGGLAFDAVSRRFVIGDALDRKLFVVGVNGGQSTDMVRADSAGFEDVAAVEIDDRRGDLWVAGAAGALHRLQLVSGRPLKTYRSITSAGAVHLTDLAVTPSGAVVGLDAEGRRLMTLGRGAETLAVTMPLSLDDAHSLALDDEDSGFVAFAEGVARVDLRARSVSPLTAPDGVNLVGIARIRVHRGAIYALQRVEANGSSTTDVARILRLDLNAGARRVTKATVIDADGASVERPFLTIDGDDLYYVARDNADADRPFVVRRLALR